MLTNNHHGQPGESITKQNYQCKDRIYLIKLNNHGYLENTNPVLVSVLTAITGIDRSSTHTKMQAFNVALEHVEHAKK